MWLFVQGGFVCHYNGPVTALSQSEGPRHAPAINDNAIDVVSPF